jgi:hypothetical protein
MKTHAVFATSAPCTKTRPTRGPDAGDGGGRMMWEDKKQGGMIRSRRRGSNREEPNMATGIAVVSLDGFKKRWPEVDVFTSFGIAAAGVAPRQRQLSQVPACCQ